MSNVKTEVVSTKTASKSNKGKSALEKLAELKAQMAALETEAQNEVNEERLRIDAKLAELAKLLGVTDQATAFRCVATFAKHGTAYPAGKSIISGETERKARVTLSDEEKAKVIKELAEMQAKKSAITVHCREIEKRPGMPGFQTLYTWATEAGLNKDNKVSAPAGK